MSAIAVKPSKAPGTVTVEFEGKKYIIFARQYPQFFTALTFQREIKILEERHR